MRTVRDTKRGSRRRNEVPGWPSRLHQRRQVEPAQRDHRAGVLVEDALFATLDPPPAGTRRADGRVYTLTDTVGFVRHLPHS